MTQKEKLESEILKIISGSPVETDLTHAKNTQQWALKLKPNADDTIKIAAIAHDIERGLSPDYHERTVERFDNYTLHKRAHSKRSAKIITELLKKYHFHKNFISKVRHLVLKHEFGGDPATNIIMNADSLSFFQNNLDQYHKRHGDEKTRAKIHFMYDRMSNKAKKIVQKMKFSNRNINLMVKEETK